MKQTNKINKIKQEQKIKVIAAAVVAIAAIFS